MENGCGGVARPSAAPRRVAAACRLTAKEVAVPVGAALLASKTLRKRRIAAKAAAAATFGGKGRVYMPAFSVLPVPAFLLLTHCLLLSASDLLLLCSSPSEALEEGKGCGSLTYPA